MVGTTKVYSGLGADIVMESISLIDHGWANLSCVPPPRWDELDEMLKAINDFLWICDVYHGQVWAAKNVSITTLNIWESDNTKK